MNKQHLKKIGSLSAIVLGLLVILSTLPVSPRSANSAASGLQLLVIYGHVSAAGTIQDGSGNFTVASGGGGVYNITFTATPGFTNPPSVIAMGGNSGAGAIVTIVEAPTASGVRIRTGHGSSGQFNGDFAFIAMGQSTAPSTKVNVIYGSINGGRGGYGTPGAMVNRGSGGWTSYLGGGPTYQVSFASGVFTQTPTVVASEEVNSPVDCILSDAGSVSTGGATLRSMTDFCSGTQYSWGSIDFIAVGVGATASPNLAIAQGTWTRNGISLGAVTVNPGSTGVSTVSNGGGVNAPSGFAVNFSSGTFATTPVVVTNVSTPSYTPVYCAGPYLPSASSAYVRFTGGSGGGTDTCTYGDDHSGYFNHTTLGATMIALGYAPVPPLLASCTVANANIPYGSSATFTANPTGGTAPYTYQWTYPLGAASCGNASTCTTNALTSSFGPRAFELNVTDVLGSQSGFAACPGVSVTQLSVVTSSFSGTMKQLTFTTTTLPSVSVSATIFVRNAGGASSTMDWSCAVDPAYVIPAGLTVDTSNCSGFGLRGGAPPFP